MGSGRAIARALSRSERAQVKAAIKAGDELGYNRNYTRGLVKFGSEGMTPEARMARARAMGFDTETPLYRGLTQPYAPDHPYAQYRGEYFATDPKVASSYADGSAVDTYGREINPTLIPAFSKSPNAREDWGGSHWTAPKDRTDTRYDYQSLDNFIGSKVGGGAQVVRADNVVDTGGEQTQVYVANPAARRSPFATFDPARAHRRDLLAGVVPVAATGGAAALAGAPQDAQAAEPSALARALAREAPRFNAALDTSLDVASIADPSLGYVTETTRALKDLPGQIQGNALQKAAGTVALAPLVGLQESVGSIGQLPELGVAGGRAIARAIARKPQPRGSQTYRKAK